jgi:protein involved in polysaccharide export with SLBB domain
MCNTNDSSRFMPTARCALPQGRRLVFCALLLCASLAVGSGCAALSNPVANGIPVRRLSPELLAESREDLERTPLSLLRQPAPPAYKLAPGDILGIWIEGVLGQPGQAPPIQLNEFGQQPSIGYPIPVRADGTISLPLVPALKVEGRTVEETEDAIRKAYTLDKAILKAGQERIITTLLRPREYHILVIRQDSATRNEPQPSSTGGGTRTAGFVINFGAGAQGSRRGTGFAINLPAYQNDVLNALARTGGFPGSDAVDEVIIERGSGWPGGIGPMPGKDGEAPLWTPGAPGVQRIRIPLRHKPGQPPFFRPEDIVLQDGDIVFIEAREADVFYTAGLLPTGEFVLPRDIDLDVVEAIARVGGTINSGGINTTNINGTLFVPGLGSPSPTLVSVIRQTPGCGQVTIRVDLDLALRDPRERILIKPRDIIILQERPSEAVARYFTQVFNFSFIYNFLNTSHAQGSIVGESLVH